jgi:hypothetical protein
MGSISRPKEDQLTKTPQVFVLSVEIDLLVVVRNILRFQKMLRQNVLSRHSLKLRGSKRGIESLDSNSLLDNKRR